MRAIYYEAFEGPVSVRKVPDPSPVPGGAVVRVEASGLCLSDWHGWMGHDPDITVPHVPGHELAGVVEAVGNDVKHWKPGDRVTLPFVCGCGDCPQCASGNQQVCDRQFQAGFTHWGSFAEYVSIHYADANLVRLPESIGFETAAVLGCRFATSFRAVVDQGKIDEGQWLAVHGCGGVGLSAIMIGKALGARVIAIDIQDNKLELARSIGAEACINANQSADVAGDVRELSGGGSHVSLDALGSPRILFDSIAGLRKRGRHVQVGLLRPENRNAVVPTDLIVARELEIMGSHGIQAYRYPEIFKMMSEERMNPDLLIGRKITLDDAASHLIRMEQYADTGVSVITDFSSRTN